MKQLYIQLVIMSIFIADTSAAYCASQRIESSIQISAFDTDEAGCLFLDSYGMMWIGSCSGLISYDGYSFQTYKSDAYSPGKLPNNYIMSLTEDHENNIWIGTRDGLAKMDRRKGTFTTYHLPQNNQRIIYTLFTSKDGTVWIGTDGGLTRFDKANGTFHTYHHTKDYSVKSIAEDKSGTLYIGTWATGLLRLKHKGNRLEQYPQRNEMNSAYKLLIDSKQRLWIGTWGYGIELLEHPEDMSTTAIRRFNNGQHDFSVIHDIIEDKLSGAIYACGRDGISTYDERKDTRFQNSGKYRFCNSMATDGAGHIYIGTMNDGIVYIYATPTLYESWRLQSMPGRSLSHIESMYTADGNTFWIGLYPYGIALHERATGKTLYDNDIPGVSQVPNFDKIAKAGISSIVQTDKGDIWMASRSYGILVYGKDHTAKILNHINSPEYIKDDYVNVLYRQNNGNIWIGQRSAIGIVTPGGRGLTLDMKDGSDDFTNCDVRGITEDRNGNVWLATENEGIIRVSSNPRQPGSLSFGHYYPGNGRLAIGEVSACLEDSNGRLWAISKSSGLFLYDKQKDRFEPKNREYHIGEDGIMTINEDDKGSLWLTNNSSIVKLSFNGNSVDHKPTVAVYANNDGAGCRLFSPNMCLKYGPMLLFGNGNGIVAFSPDNHAKIKASRKPRLIISDIAIDNTPLAQLPAKQRDAISPEMPAFTRKITIPADVSKLEIDFALLTYINQKQNKYAYRLEGYDSEWHYCEASQHSAQYKNLPAGTYSFKLKASDSFGNWQHLPYSIEIRVMPPWYLTWWAYALYIIILAGGVFAGIEWYKRHLKTKNRLQMATLFTNLTHELLTPLTVISAAVDEMTENAPQFDRNYVQIRNNIGRLTRLLRQILEIRKSQAGQLRLKVSKGDLAAFITKECDNIRPMADARGQTITVSTANIRQKEAWFDPDKMDKIIYNLLSNAIKYNRDNGNVTVTLTTERNMAVMEIRDEGIGISKDKMKSLYTRFLDGDYRRKNTTGTGIGLSLTHDLVELHHGDIDCKSAVGQGTTFTVRIPTDKKSYSEAETEETGADDIISLYAGQDADEPQEREPHTSGFSYNNADSHRHRILIVEDNEELLELMQRLFNKKYETYTAKNGKQALNTIHRTELDIVISDVMMPVMDGMELTREIKKSKDFRQLPIILLTAKTQEEDRYMIYETGADAYITKPFKMDELQLRVDNIISNRIRIKETFTGQPGLAATEKHYSNPDKAFVQKATECVKAHINDFEYDRETFARDMCVSSSTLYNKLKAITGYNVTGFITNVRLKEAARIIRQNPDMTITELSMKVGFNTAKYFSKCFKKEFGMSVKEYTLSGTGGNREPQPVAHDDTAPRP